MTHPLRPSPTVVDPRSMTERAEQRVSKLGELELVPITVPRTSTSALMRICTRRETSAARAGARAALKDKGFSIEGGGVASLGALEEWNYEFGLRILAAAVRDPKHPERALAALEEWEEHCDEDQIAALMRLYDDHRARVDPLADTSLTDAELAAIVDAAKKKDADLLMEFGSRKLSSFILTSVVPPAISPTPTY